MSISRTSEASRIGVLFVCEDNSRLSLIAEALMREHFIPWARGFSAGIHPADHGDLRALSTIMLAGLDNSGLWPKSWEGFAKSPLPIIDVVVTLDQKSANELSNTFPGSPEYRNWSETLGYVSATKTHAEVWREIQWLRTKVNALVDDLSAMRELSMSEQPLAAE